MAEITYNDLKELGLKAIEDLLSDAPDLILDLKNDLEEIAITYSKWGIQALAGSDQAKDILKVLNARILTIGATIAGRAQNKLAAWFQVTAPIILSAILKAIAMALGIPLVL